MLLPTQVSYQDLLTEADVTPQCRPLTTQTLCEVTHGEVRLLEGMTFLARHGYNFEIALSSLDTEGDESMSLVQLGFRKIFHSIHRLASTVQQGKRVHPGEGPDQTEMHARLITVTIVPPIRQGNPSNSFEFLHFHSVLQSFWQPLSLLSAISTCDYMVSCTLYSVCVCGHA